MDTLPASIDRRNTSPFLLRVFYRDGSFPLLSEFTHANALPTSINIHTWPDITLLELSKTLLSSIHSSSSESTTTTLRDLTIGTRLCFRLIYPDTRPSALALTNRSSETTPPSPRFLIRDLGTLVVGGGEELERGNEGPEQTARSDESVRLSDGRFVVGDFLAVAILAPLRDGSVAPPIAASGTVRVGRSISGVVPSVPGARDDRHQSQNQGREFTARGGFHNHHRGRNAEWRSGSERGSFGRGQGGFGMGRGGGPERVPEGDWRRGEVIPRDSNGANRRKW